jgi:CrcB protein
MTRALLIGFGGLIGTLMRYGMGLAITRAKQGAMFPWETFAVNVLGCVAIGCLAGFSEARDLFSETTRAFLFVGVLGGFTTFSTFAYEAVSLARGGYSSTAFWAVALQLLLGLAAVWLAQRAALRWGG